MAVVRLAALAGLLLHALGAAAGTCTHPSAGSFTGSACLIDALERRLQSGTPLPRRPAARLGLLLAEARASVATAEVDASVGHRDDARRFLRRAARRLVGFIRRVAHLEAHQRIDSAEAGMLLDAAHDTTLSVGALRATLKQPRPPRSSD